ncbi:MAG: hypothetical protein JWL62_4 [Hyphomicrobiales bacterium]|nr:hypothetical protein [Hyphomicrobiales bacterium]
MSPRLRIALVAFVAFVAAGFGAAPASAATGFLENVFGRQQQVQSPTFERYHAPELAQPLNIRPNEAAVRKAKRLKQMQAQRRKIQRAKLLAKNQARQRAAAGTVVAAAQTAPAPSVTTPSTPEEAISKVLSDDTLRPGDVYMAQDGLRVFVGVEKKTNASRNRFVPVTHARDISPALRARLVELERKTVANPPVMRTAKALPSEGPPVQLAMASAPERYITDARGRTIRVVGEPIFCCTTPVSTSALEPAPQRATQMAQR